MGKGDTAESVAGLDTSHRHPPLGHPTWFTQNPCISLFPSYPLFPKAPLPSGHCSALSQRHGDINLSQDLPPLLPLASSWQPENHY